jgi:hypothetical protein
MWYRCVIFTNAVARSRHGENQHKAEAVPIPPEESVDTWAVGLPKLDASPSISLQVPRETAQQDAETRGNSPKPENTFQIPPNCLSEEEEILLDGDSCCDDGDEHNLGISSMLVSQSEKSPSPPARLHDTEGSDKESESEGDDFETQENFQAAFVPNNAAEPRSVHNKRPASRESASEAFIVTNTNVRKHEMKFPFVQTKSTKPVASGYRQRWMSIATGYPAQPLAPTGNGALGGDVLRSLIVKKPRRV